MRAMGDMTRGEQAKGIDERFAAIAAINCAGLSPRVDGRNNLPSRRMKSGSLEDSTVEDGDGNQSSMPTGSAENAG